MAASRTESTSAPRAERPDAKRAAEAGATPDANGRRAAPDRPTGNPAAPATASIRRKRDFERTVRRDGRVA
ncbi:hypothetical protein AQ611_20530 [Burkholderia singularis]|nr:hypothetical protein AQ611_20530 [Burkholderia sp. Bp7605]